MKNSESQFHWTVAVHRQVKKSNLKKKNNRGKNAEGQRSAGLIFMLLPQS